jgi:ABC-type polysaccharide/polyol phosphate export permease
MANQDIMMRYRRSVLGPFWISIATAVLVLGIGTLYAGIQNQDPQEFLTYFGWGQIAWLLLSSMIIDSTQAVLESEGHMRSVSVPLPMLCARIVQRNFVIYMHNAVVIGIMVAIFHKFPSPIGLLALPGLLLYCVLGFMAGLLLGPICARFRDLTQVIVSVVQMVFFLTPIFWVAGAPGSRPIVVDLNPFYHLLEIVRRPLLGDFPTTTNWAVSLGVLLLVTILGFATFGATRRKIFLWL